MKSVRTEADPRRVRVLVNPKSGLGTSFDVLREAVEIHFGRAADVAYQFSRDVDDGRRKAERAVRDGVEILRYFEDHRLVRLPRDLPGDVGPRHGRGGHDPPRLRLPAEHDPRPHRRAHGDPVVDEDHRPPLQRRERPPSPTPEP